MTMFQDFHTLGRDPGQLNDGAKDIVHALTHEEHGWAGPITQARDRHG
jgi:hypothetical protein